MKKHLKEKLVQLLKEKEVTTHYFSEAVRLKKLAERITGKQVVAHWDSEEYESWGNGRYYVWY